MSAGEIERPAHHMHSHLEALGDVPAVIAWPNAAFFAGMAYWLRDYHVAVWGGPLFVAGLFLAWHAFWRDNGRSNSKRRNVIFLIVYATIFAEVIRALWVQDHHYLAVLICLTGLVAVNALLRTLLGRLQSSNSESTHN